MSWVVSMSASTGRFLASIVILFFWYDRRFGISRRPLPSVKPTERFSLNTSTPGLPVSTTANASSIRFARNTPLPMVTTAPSTSAVALAPLPFWRAPISMRA